MSIFNYEVKNKDGSMTKIEQFKGNVMLIVNSATGCGFTPQYEGLEKLYADYKDKGFTVLDFPCNQFGNQAKGTDTEISSFCSLNYGVTYPQFAKIEVNGSNEDPLYTFLKSQKSGLLNKNIKWNFTKFLVNRNGEVVARFAPTTKPSEIENKIKELL